MTHDCLSLLDKAKKNALGVWACPKCDRDISVAHGLWQETLYLANPVKRPGKPEVNRRHRARKIDLIKERAVELRKTGQTVDDIALALIREGMVNSVTGATVRVALIEAGCYQPIPHGPKPGVRQKTENSLRIAIEALEKITHASCDHRVLSCCLREEDIAKDALSRIRSL